MKAALIGLMQSGKSTIISAISGKEAAPVGSVTIADKFWPAEDYHQQYYKKKKTLPYCHSYKKRF